MAHVSSNPSPPVSLQPLDCSLSLMAQSKAIKNTCKHKLRTWKLAGNSRRYALCVDYSSPSLVSLQPLYRSSSLIAWLKAYKNTYQHNLRSHNTRNSQRFVQRVMHGQSMVASSPQCVSKAAVKSGQHSVSEMCPRGTLFSVDLNTNRGPIAKSRVKMISQHESKGRARRYPHLFFMDPAKVFAARTKLVGVLPGATAMRMVLTSMKCLCVCFEWKWR